MKIITTTLLATVFITWMSIAQAQANPFTLVRDVIIAVDNNIGPRAVLGCHPRTPVYYVPQYPYQPRQESSFYKKVTYIENGEVYRAAPPPQAYKYVTYPGQAPKHLYKDPSISVSCSGSSHTVIYRRPGW